MGPMTGRAAGYCTGYAAPGFMNPALGRGLGMAGGRGAGGGLGMAWRRGWGRGSGLGPGGEWSFPPGPLPAPYAPPEPAPEQQLAALHEQADRLKQQMDAVNERIRALQGTED